MQGMATSIGWNTIAGLGVAQLHITRHHSLLTDMALPDPAPGSEAVHHRGEVGSPSPSKGHDCGPAALKRQLLVDRVRQSAFVLGKRLAQRIFRRGQVVGVPMVRGRSRGAQLDAIQTTRLVWSMAPAPPCYSSRSGRCIPQVARGRGEDSKCRISQHRHHGGGNAHAPPRVIAITASRLASGIVASARTCSTILSRSVSGSTTRAAAIASASRVWPSPPPVASCCA